MTEAIKVDILNLMNFLEKEYKDPSVRWKTLREMIETQKVIQDKLDNGELSEVARMDAE